MKLEFERKDGLSCVEFIYKAMAESMGLNYELAFIESWSFGFDKESRVAHSNEGNREENLYKFHGLKVVNHYLSERDDSSLVINDLLNKYGVCMILTDLYYIPWSATCYQKRHWNHAVLIVDIVENGYYCYDFYAMDGAVLPTSSLSSVRRIVTFEKDDFASPIKDFSSFKSLLLKTLNHKIDHCKAFDAMAEFADDVRYRLDIHQIASDAYSFENSRFINAVNRVAQCRFQFSAVLEYANECYSEACFDEYVELLKKCAVSWKSITALLIKAYLVKDSSRVLKKVAEKVIEAQKLEKHIYGQLKNQLELQETREIISTQEVLTEEKNHFYYDLSNIFNHKAFGDYANSQDARFEHRSFMVFDEQLQKGYLYTDGLAFKLAEVKTTNYDNVECCGQRLKINRRCNAIMILANAEFDHQIDWLIIESGKERIKVEVSASSWQCTPILGDKVLWSGAGAVQYMGAIEIDEGKKYLFGKKYLLPYSIYIDSIQLPDNPNFHIYALTLCEQ